MKEARTEVSGYHVTVDQFGRTHIVVEHSEFVSQPHDERLPHGWRTYMTADGQRLERLADGTFVTAEPVVLKLQRTAASHRLSPDTGTPLDE